MSSYFLAEDMLQANRSQLRTLCEHLVEYADEGAVKSNAAEPESEAVGSQSRDLLD